MNRPKSLRDVAERVLQFKTGFDQTLRDFLHQFNLDGRPATSLMEEPRYMQFASGVDSEKGLLQDAMLAALAEHFCTIAQVEPPEWCHEITRFLNTPWFALDSDEGKVFLMCETPPSFKKRNIFITGDSFTVA